jgi:hypothetical protein
MDELPIEIFSMILHFLQYEIELISKFLRVSWNFQSIVSLYTNELYSNHIDIIHAKYLLRYFPNVKQTNMRISIQSIQEWNTIIDWFKNGKMEICCFLFQPKCFASLDRSMSIVSFIQCIYQFMKSTRFRVVNQKVIFDKFDIEFRLSLLNQEHVQFYFKRYLKQYKNVIYDNKVKNGIQYNESNRMENCKMITKRNSKFGKKLAPNLVPKTVPKMVSYCHIPPVVIQYLDPILDISHFIKTFAWPTLDSCPISSLYDYPVYRYQFNILVPIINQLHINQKFFKSMIPNVGDSMKKIKLILSCVELPTIGKFNSTFYAVFNTMSPIIRKITLNISFTKIIGYTYIDLYIIFYDRLNTALNNFLIRNDVLKSQKLYKFKFQLPLTIENAVLMLQMYPNIKELYLLDTFLQQETYASIPFPVENFLPVEQELIMERNLLIEKMRQCYPNLELKLVSNIDYQKLNMDTNRDANMDIQILPLNY